MSSSNDGGGGLLGGLLGGGNEDEDTTTQLLSQTTNTRQTQFTATATASPEEDDELTSAGIGVTRTTNLVDSTGTGVATPSSALLEGDTTSATEATRTVGQAASSSSAASLNTASGILSGIQSQTGTLSSLSQELLLSSTAIQSSLISSITSITSNLVLSSTGSTLSSTPTISSTRSLAISSSSSNAISSTVSETTSEEITSTEETATETTPPVIVTISAGQNVTLTSSIFSTPPPMSSDNTSKEAANDNKDDTSILNTDNKLFPLGVILVVVGSIIALVTILWFLMKVFGITRRRKRLRGAIPSFVPPERIDFPDESNEKYDGYPSVHHHHQRSQSNSSWDYMPGYDTAPAGGRSITPMEGGNLAGFGVGHTNHQDIIPDFPPAGQQYIPPSQMLQDQYQYPQQQNPFMVDNLNYNNNSRESVPVRSNSQSSNSSNSHDRYGLTRKGTVTDAYGGMETDVQRNGSVGNGHNLNKSRDWQSGAGGYV